MKNKMVLAGMFNLVLAFGVLVIGCDTGSTNLGPDTVNVMYATVSKDCDTYVLKGEINNRSVRVLTQDNTYEFRVIIPKNNNGGAGAAAFDTIETIIVTAISKEPVGGSGKEKWTLKRTDDQKIIYVTFENDAITNINGPGISGNAYTDDDPFIPIGDNNNSLDGAWFGIGLDGTPYNITIDGDTMTVIKPPKLGSGDPYNLFKFDFSYTETQMSGTNNQNWDFATGEYYLETVHPSSFTDAPYSLSSDKNTITVNMGDGDEEYARVLF